MKIKQLIEGDGNSISFHINEDGALVIETGGKQIEIPHLTALELIEYIRCKLYDHQEANESLLKRLFK